MFVDLIVILLFKHYERWITFVCFAYVIFFVIFNETLKPRQCWNFTYNLKTSWSLSPMNYKDFKDVLFK